MSRPNQRLDTSDDASAYRVASLLRQQSTSTTRHHNSNDTTSLRSMTSQIEQFLAMAPQVPAVRMEPEWDASGANEEAGSYTAQPSHRDGQPVVQLSVVAGVLEEVDPATANSQGSMSSVNGVLLPTAANQQELHRRKVEQAQAMLNLMSALTPSVEGDNAAAPVSRGAVRASPNLSTRVLQHSSSSTDSDNEEVAVMDADDLNDEDTSDDDMPAQRRRIQEMN